MWQPTSDEGFQIAKLLLAQASVDICTCAQLGITERRECSCWQTLEILDFQMDVNKTIITIPGKVITLTTWEV